MTSFDIATLACTCPQRSPGAVGLSQTDKKRSLALIVLVYMVSILTRLCDIRLKLVVVFFSAFTLRDIRRYEDQSLAKNLLGDTTQRTLSLRL